MSYLVGQMRPPRYLTPDDAAATAFGLPRIDLQVLWEAISINVQIPGIGKIGAIPGHGIELDTKGGYTDQQLKNLVYQIAHIEQSELEKHQESCRQAIIYRDRMLDELAWTEKDRQLSPDMRRQEKRPTSDYVNFFQKEGHPELAARLSPETSPLSKLPEELPTGLDQAIAAYKKYWINADPSDPETQPKNQDIQDWLIKQGVPKRQAEIIPNLIRPRWAFKGNRKIRALNPPPHRG